MDQEQERDHAEEEFNRREAEQEAAAELEDYQAKSGELLCRSCSYFPCRLCGGCGCGHRQCRCGDVPGAFPLYYDAEGEVDRHIVAHREARSVAPDAITRTGVYLGERRDV